MTVFAFASVKGSPGATTLACLVAASWRSGRRAVLVELDPGGGDLAIRFGLSPRIGWSALEGAARHGRDSIDVESHLQVLPGGLQVLAGGAPDASSGQRRQGREPAERALLDFAHSADVIIDLGRLPCDLDDAGRWLAAATAVCIVARPDPSSIVHVRDRAAALRQRCGGRLALVLVGTGRHRTTEIAEFTGMEIVGEIPHDPGMAAVLTVGDRSKRRLVRSGLASASRRLADALGDFAGADQAHGLVGPQMADAK